MAIRPQHITSADLGIITSLEFDLSLGGQQLTSLPCLMVGGAIHNHSASSPVNVHIYSDASGGENLVGVLAAQANGMGSFTVPAPGAHCPAGIYTGAISGTGHGVIYVHVLPA